MTDNKKQALQWMEQVWNQGRADQIDHFIAADSVIHGLTDHEGKCFASHRLPPAHLRKGTAISAFFGSSKKETGASRPFVLPEGPCLSLNPSSARHRSDIR